MYDERQLGQRSGSGRRFAPLALAWLLSMPSLASAVCIGDCNDDGTITMRELVSGAERVVGRIRNCPAADADLDGTVVIEEMVRAVQNAAAGCVPPPTPTTTPTPTAVRSATPTQSPTPPSFGPQITFFGMISPSNRRLTPLAVENGIPVYRQPAGLGAGFFLVVESRPGTSGGAPGTLAFSGQDGVRPDIQILANRDLGSGSGRGSTAICDIAPPTVGGVPGFDPPDFGPSQAVTDALNDFGCRFANNSLSPCILGDDDNERFANPQSTTQFCTEGTVSRAMEFPRGDTLLVVQWRDGFGNIGNPARMIVRVD